MLGLNTKRGVVASAKGSMSPYAERLVDDEKVQRRVVAAIEAAIAARRRVSQQAGQVATATRIAADPVLRRQLAEVMTQLQKAQKRVQRKRSHKLRNSLLVLAGFGAASAAVAAPAVRSRALKLFRRDFDAGGGGLGADASGPTTLEEEIEVAVSVSTAYNQWTQFEEFPTFMEGVEQVRQLDDTLLHWAVNVAGKHAEWDAKILEQEPDRRITWESVDGKQTRGTVTFDEVGPSRTRIRLTMRYLPEGLAEKAGSAAGLDRRRVRGDLERFQQLVEARGSETGAWRGRIEDGVETT